jgi:hypothetical protein
MTTDTVELPESARRFDGHARTCVVGVEAELQEDRTAELMAAVGRLMRRG